MKIGFASDNETDINQHFGSTKSFTIYNIDKFGYRFLELVTIGEYGDDSDDKIDERINALKDCSIIYCTQIGGTAAARLVKNKIFPVKMPIGYPISEALSRLKDRLHNNPPIWLKKRKETNGR